MSSFTKPFSITIDPTFPGDLLSDIAPSVANVKTTTTPGLLQTLTSYTVPALKVLRLHSVIVNCRQNSFFNLLENTTLIASGVLGAADPESVFEWERYKEIAASGIIKIEFEQGNGPSIDVYAHIHASLVDA